MKRAILLLVFVFAAPCAMAQQATAMPAGLDDLPLVAVPPARAGSGRMAIIVTGDGGWAGLVHSIADSLAADGVGVVGLNSLKYFWSARTPEETTRAVERLAEGYGALWHAPQLLLVGYSFGADVLPAVVNRLRPDVRARVAGLTLIAPSPVANFEVKVTGWLGVRHAGDATLPDIARLRGLPMACIYGDADGDAVCPQLPAGLARVEKLGGGHHFDGDFAAVVSRVLR